MNTATAEVVYLKTTEEYVGIKIDRTKDQSLSEQAKKLLTDYYQTKDEISPQQAYARAAVAYSYGDMELAQKIYDYVSDGWFMFASPVLSNAPMPGEKTRALPISCFLTYVPDTLEGLIDHSAELRWLSVKGGGVGGHWSDVRAVSDKAPGPMPFIHTVDADMTAYRQGKTRKGSYAAYMDISHPDIIEFLNMRIPTGDVNRKNLNLHHAVNISDAFMRAVERDEMWDLVDPNEQDARDSMKARKLWETVLETRYRTGEPYLNFIDTANRALPQTMKDKGLKINGSNLCLVGDTKLDCIIDGDPCFGVTLEYICKQSFAADVKVLSYNVETGETSYQRVLSGSLMNNDADLIRIEDEETGNFIECTPDHRVFTKNRGYVKAEDLNEDDDLVFG